MNDIITKEEMVKILMDNLDSYLRINRAPLYQDYTDYEHLDDEEYNDIADYILSDINETILNKRTLKIKKIKENLK
jgi:hypothetical protein